MSEPFTAIIPADALDVSALPPHARQPGTEAFKRAVSEMLAGDLLAFGLDGTIKVTDDQITLTWQDTGKAEGSVDRAVKLLRSGDYARGIRLLQILDSIEPGNPYLHFNLGAALSDKGKFDEARKHLVKCIEIAPDNIDARTTFGLTFARQGRHEEALPIFEEAARLAPENPFVWRALGGTLRLMPDRSERAEQCLKKAVDLAPTDPVAWYGLAEARELLEDWDGASEAFRECLKLKPGEKIAQKAEEGINRMTSKTLRPTMASGEEMIRMDAVLYMQEALAAFAKMPKDQLQKVAYELALAGQEGLDLKDPTPKHKLKLLPGDFSGMKIVSYMYAAFQQFMPGADVGIELSREYAAAKGA